jgi:probable F420-dependent oxidoreductase
MGEPASGLSIGITMLLTDRSIAPHGLARAVEDRGFDAIYFAEHSHIPASRETKFPGASPSRPELPDVYWHLQGQVASLAMAAAVTERITLGTSVTLVPQHDPIWLAKELATIDHVSGGRLELGVGYGWNREEYEAHGRDFTERRARTADCIAIMRSLWTDEVSVHDGDHASLADSWSWPKSPQRRGPRVLLGSALGPKTLAAMAAWADGWMPIRTPELDLPRDLERVRRAFEDAGRDPASVYTVVMNGPTDRAGLDQLVELGVQGVALTVWAEEPDDVLSTLDRFGELSRPAA